MRFFPIFRVAQKIGLSLNVSHRGELTVGATGSDWCLIFHYDEPSCDEVTDTYQERYGSGVSVLCEDPSVGGYVH